MEANRAKGSIRPKEIQSTSDRMKAYAKQDEQKIKKDIFTKDIWEMGTLKDQRSEFKSMWIDQNVAEHNICNTGTPVAAVPKSAFHKRSQLK